MQGLTSLPLVEMRGVICLCSQSQQAAGDKGRWLLLYFVFCELNHHICNSYMEKIKWDLSEIRAELS